jgi:hypothetical protein
MKKTGAHTIGGYVAVIDSGGNKVLGGNFDVSGSFSSGITTTTAPVDSRIRRVEQWGTDVYRCSETFRMTASGTLGSLRLGPVVSTIDTSNSAIGTQLAFAAPQIELGAIPTSFIPTTAAAVTRNADVINLSGAVSGCIGQTEGTIYAEVDVRNLGVETYLIRIDDGASTNVVSLRKLNTNNVRSAITAPTTSGTINISSATFTAGILKIAFAYKSGEIALCVNGANLTANGTFTFGASFNRVSVGSNITAGTELNDRIRSLAIYTTRLTNAELQSLTTL